MIQHTLPQLKKNCCPYSQGWYIIQNDLICWLMNTCLLCCWWLYLIQKGCMIKYKTFHCFLAKKDLNLEKKSFIGWTAIQCWRESEGNTCHNMLFIKIAGCRSEAFHNKKFSHQCFPGILFPGLSKYLWTMVSDITSSIHPKWFHLTQVSGTSLLRPLIDICR